MNPATVLIVDDEPQIRRVMRTTLTSQGYAVLEAKTGEEALEKLRSDHPGLILLDVNLPGISGLDVCREIRQSSDVPIIMLTVRNTERDKVQALDAGADDYVVKPFGAQELLARIRAAVQSFAGKRKAFFYCNSGNRVGATLIPYLMLDAGLDQEAAVETAMKCGMRSAELMEWALEYVKRKG